MNNLFLSRMKNKRLQTGMQRYNFFGELRRNYLKNKKIFLYEYKKSA